MKKLLFALMLLMSVCAVNDASAQLQPPLPADPLWCFKWRSEDVFNRPGGADLASWGVWGNAGTMTASQDEVFPTGQGGASVKVSIGNFAQPGSFVAMDHFYDARAGWYTSRSNAWGCQPVAPTIPPPPSGVPKYCSMVVYVMASTAANGSVQLLDSNYYFLATQNFNFPASPGVWRMVQTPVSTNCSQNVIARVGFNKLPGAASTRAYVDFVTVNWWY